MDEQPFHDGELAVQALTGRSARGSGIRSFMPDQHREFFALLPYAFAAGLDAQGWPIATLLTGAPGFIASPTPTALTIAGLPAADDPAAPALAQGMPIGLLGLDLATRRRNRANGTITAMTPIGFDVSIQQSFGNCAKYIQLRDVRPGEVSSRSPEPLASLDEQAVALIAGADTMFVASRSATTADGETGLDISHRGGKPGFVRIDGDVLTIPDFVGNNYFNTLGNLVQEPRAALLFVDFATGDLLQLQGRAGMIWDGPEVERLAGAERLWRFAVVRGWRRRGAVPLCWSQGETAVTTEATGTWLDTAAMA